MGCSNFLTGSNIAQIFNWKPVPADKRYEEKLVQYKSGRITRMTRLAGQTTNYPHYTQFYNASGQSEAERTHQSTDQGKKGQHITAHKTVDAIFADLDEAIRSLRSGR